MIKRLLIAATVTCVIALLTVSIWARQKDRDEHQISRIAEAESYAARSQLIRNVELMIDALRNARLYWSTYGHQPREQWASDAAVELSHFDGVKLILWDDPEHGNRYVRTPQNSALDYRPDDTEWQHYQALVSRLRQQTESAMLGPFISDEGNPTFELHIVDEYSPSGGRVAALVDAPASLAVLLRDESPGYALTVSWRDIVLYQRGQAAANSPEKWTRSGLIESSLGPLWKVQHAPTDELQESFAWRTGDTSLLLGLAIAVLVGTLVFENGRARIRAGAAESAEQKLAELNRGLEGEIDRRTEALATRTAVLQTITDSVSHDLRNPLNSISMNTNLLQRQMGESESADKVVVFERIERGIRQMIEILDRLLGLSSATHSAFNPEPLNMRELIQSVFNELVATEQPPPVRLEMSDLPDATGDKRLVRMLVMNLLGNALKYTQKCADRQISVDFESSDNGVTYSIRDNGIGFDSQHAENMFAAFHRLDNAAGSDGHGLGLAIAASVVNRHGGRIWARAAPGEGATFCFTLTPSPANH